MSEELPERPGEDRLPEPTEETPTAASERPTPALKLPAAPHADRFRFVLGAVIGLGIAAVIVAVGLALHGTGPSTDWSNWHPSSDGADGPAQIAAHVSGTYRLPNGEQIVAVKAGPLKVADLDLNVAVREGGGAIKLFNGKGVRYTMCGLGSNCSIATGKPSVERGLLLQREALELALYTFEYIPGVQNVVAFLPPKPGEQATQGKAVFFRRDQVSAPLDHPLRATLPSPTPTLDTLRASDIDTVERLAGHGIHCFSYRVGQDVSAFLVLDPPVASCKGGTG
jgi:hypothetical protein